MINRNVCLQGEVSFVNLLTWCLYLRRRQQHRKIKTHLPTITAFICMTEDANKIFCSKHVANLLLHEVMSHRRLHQSCKPNLACPWGCWCSGERHCICSIYVGSEKLFYP